MEQEKLERILRNWSRNLQNSRPLTRAKFLNQFGLSPKEKEVINCAIDSGIHLILALQGQ